ncbi:MAG: DUF554 domain-containing protein [Candidatus Hodarchaeales archaeon]
MLGTIINIITIIIGSFFGLTLGRFYTEKMKNITIKSLGLITVIIGIQMCINSERSLGSIEFLLLIFAMVLGSITGVILDIEANLEKFAEWIKTKTKSRIKETKFVEGFVIASIIFETGPLAILGSIQDGLTQDLTLLLIKSTLDGIMALALSASFGIGVVFSIITVFIYQGSITMIAIVFGAGLSNAILAMISIVGGVLIVGLGIRILEIQDLPIGNMIPAIIWIIPIASIFEILGLLV